MANVQPAYVKIVRSSKHDCICRYHVCAVDLVRIGLLQRVLESDDAAWNPRSYNVVPPLGVVYKQLRLRTFNYRPSSWDLEYRGFYDHSLNQLSTSHFEDPYF
jgi:hypothetical protein